MKVPQNPAQKNFCNFFIFSIDKTILMHYTNFCCERQVQQHVRLAQLDRASGYGPEGRGFESSIARI